MLDISKLNPQRWRDAANTKRVEPNAAHTLINSRFASLQVRARTSSRKSTRAPTRDSRMLLSTDRSDRSINKEDLEFSCRQSSTTGWTAGSTACCRMAWCRNYWISITDTTSSGSSLTCEYISRERCRFEDPPSRFRAFFFTRASRNLSSPDS